MARSKNMKTETILLVAGAGLAAWLLLKPSAAAASSAAIPPAAAAAGLSTNATVAAQQIAANPALLSQVNFDPSASPYYKAVGDILVQMGWSI